MFTRCRSEREGVFASGVCHCSCLNLNRRVGDGWGLMISEAEG